MRPQDVLIIVRHGRPALSRRVKLSWREFREWWVQYDAGGLVEGQIVPPKVRQLGQESDLIISSPLRRAVESAHMATDRAPDAINPDLIEAALPSPPLPFIKLGPRSWGTIARIVWFCGYSDGMESVGAARLRAAKAAKNMGEQADGGKQVFITAHGWFNRMLKTALKRQGWKCVWEKGDLHWSYRRFERTTNGQKG